MTGILFTISLLLAAALAAGWVTYAGTSNKKLGMLIGTIAVLLVAGGCTWYLTQTASGSRSVKSAVSDVSGGLDRTVKVYDLNGKLIEEYHGRIDVRPSETSGRVVFDLNGERITIDGGIVITEEQKSE